MRFAAFKEITRIEQTLFALPFVLSSALLCLPYANFSISWLLVLPAFMLARISGMTFNQLIDRHIDACNPRTQTRALPTNRVTPLQARVIAWGSLTLFGLICMQMNLLTALLSLCAASLIYVYSYMKRVHYICHLVLASIHFLGPVMACSAITSQVSYPSIFLGVAAGLSIFGNDIVYAMQDYHFDLAHHLHSIPAKFGIEKAQIISILSHSLVLFTLIKLGIYLHLSFFYYSMIPLLAVIYIYFHKVIHTNKPLLKNSERSFFFCTISISFTVFFFLGISSLWLV